MADDRWDDLIKSPYDADPDESTRGRSVVVLYLVAVVLGAGAGWIVSNLAESEVTAATTSTAIEAVTTTTTAGVVDPAFLDGFISVGESAMMPILQFEHEGRTYVAVSEIVRSDGDPETIRPMVTGKWEIVESAGTSIANREITAVMSPGIRLVEFDGAVASDSIQVWSGTTPDGQSSCPGCSRADFPAADGEIDLQRTDFPIEIQMPVSEELARGLSLVIDTVLIDEDWGYAEWRAVGDEGGAIAFDMIVTFPGSGDTEAQPPDDAQLMALYHMGPSFGQSQAAVQPRPTREGAIQLYRFHTPITADNPPSTTVVRWTARWTYPVNESFQLPMPPPWTADSNGDGG
jgi:hypothetical protein